MRRATRHFRRWLDAARGARGAPARGASERVMAALIAVQRDPRGRWILQRAAARRRARIRRVGASGTARSCVRSSIEPSSTRGYPLGHRLQDQPAYAAARREEFLDREVERYRPQLERYALLARKLGPEPVRVGLYFPLMSAWREWSPEAPDSGN